MAHFIKPTVGGSVDIWGTMLNAVIDAIHDDLDALVAGQSSSTNALHGDFRIAAGAGIELAPGEQWNKASLGTLIFSTPSSETQAPLAFRLPTLPVGDLLTTIRSYGVQTNLACQISLVKVAANGVVTPVSSGHALPSSAGSTETAGIDHTVEADVDYYILATPGVGAGSLSLSSVGYTVAAA